MHRIPLIALTAVLVLAPLVADAQNAIRRLPGQRGIVVQGGREAIGPKQDDPRATDCGGIAGTTDIQGIPGKAGGENDPKAHAGNGAVAIGPKQDDPSTRGIIVQGGIEAIGPKQDDPRALTAVQQRPGDDNDPKAKCAPAAAGSAR